MGVRMKVVGSKTIGCSMYQVRLDNLSFESVPATVLEIFNTLDTKDRQK